MAGPVAHVVFAEKVLRSYLVKDERQFIIGTLFPDIRSLGVIGRAATHPKGLCAEDVRGEAEPFRAGMLFHALVDEAREKFVVGRNAYAGLPDSYLSTVALKVCEDLALYKQSGRWPAYVSYLRGAGPLPQEKSYNIADDKIHQWHDMHAGFLAGPSIGHIEEHENFFINLGMSHAQIGELFGLVRRINADRTVDRYIYDFYQDLERILG